MTKVSYQFQHIVSRLDLGDSIENWLKSSPTLESAWNSAQNAENMLYLAGKVGVDQKFLVFSACDIAESVLCLVPDGEIRPKAAIDTARGWAAGEAAEDRNQAHRKSLADSAEIVRRHICWEMVEARLVLWAAGDGCLKA